MHIILNFMRANLVQMPVIDIGWHYSSKVIELRKRKRCSVIKFTLFDIRHKKLSKCSGMCRLGRLILIGIIDQ